MLDTLLRCLDPFLRRGDIFEDRSSCIAYTLSARRPPFDGLSSGNLTFSQHVHHAAALVDSDSLTMQNVADKERSSFSTCPLYRRFLSWNVDNQNLK